MDPRGNIYAAAEGDIPVEDATRLEGYLKGRADAVALGSAQAGDPEADAARLREIAHHHAQGHDLLDLYRAPRARLGRELPIVERLNWLLENLRAALMPGEFQRGGIVAAPPPPGEQ
jgi:hypothetical protein